MYHVCSWWSDLFVEFPLCNDRHLSRSSVSAVSWYVLWLNESSYVDPRRVERVPFGELRAALGGE
eukprot:scaffold1150_cov152-Amphora_coffeaeformis.AAC.6